MLFSYWFSRLFVVIFLVDGQSDIQCWEQCEYVGLKGTEYQFKREDEECQQYRWYGHRVRVDNEYHREEAQYEDVAACDVREKTDKQCEWFCEHTDYLDWYENYLHECRYAWHCEVVFPISFCTVPVCYDKCKDCQNTLAECWKEWCMEDEIV